MSAKDTKRVVLLDAHAILHRAYHAVPGFSSSKGEPTGALYGLATMLLKLIADLKPDYLIACFDRPEKTYRHEAYDGYKAGRKKAEDDLVVQIKRSRDLFAALGVPCYELPGFEADDLLGTIVEKLKKDAKLDIIIASGDHDTLQLVEGKKVRVYTMRKGIQDTALYDEDAVKNRYGFAPKLLPDYKGLAGDQSDNIIGVDGIGEKSATELIQKFGSIEEMYHALKRGKEKLRAAGIKDRVIDKLEKGEEEARFSKMLAEIRRDAPIEFTIPARDWREGVPVDAAKRLFTELDFRTMGKRLFEVLGANDPAPTKMILSILQPPPTARALRETGIALWIIDSTKTNPTLDDIRAFAGEDDFETARKKVFDELRKRKLEKLYEEIELPLMPIVDEMCGRGITVDPGYLRKLSRDYHKELSDREREVWKLTGMEFNINSSKQLAEALFDTLGLSAKGLKKTDGGARSTRESELLKLSDAHPVIKIILEHRELQKLLSTYIDSIPTQLDPHSRLHTTFIQAGSTTGRMASENPNLQNIPVKSERGRAIRNAFIAAEGHTLVALDYSQIELRVAAILSVDPKLVEIFREGKDVHAAVASEIFGVPEERVDERMRREAKVVNFGILYGMGVNALKENLGSDRAHAQEYYRNYFEHFNVLAAYLDEVKASAAAQGYTETLFGRRRAFEGLRSHIPYIRAAAERMAVNAPLQGTAADIMKLAMIKVQNQLVRSNIRAHVHPLLTVHDEVMYEIESDMVKKTVPEIKSVMESVLSPKQSKGVPIVVNISVGKSWGTLSDFNVSSSTTS